MTDIGSQLRATREAKGLTLAQAYKATRIKVVYLEALEANRHDAMPGPVQARGFVRSYANFLGLDGEALAAALDMHPAAVVEAVQTAPLRSASVSAPSAATLAKPLSPPPDRAMPKPRSIELPSIPRISLGGNDTSSASPGGIPTAALIIGAVVLFVIGALLIINALTASGARPTPSSLPDVPNSVNAVMAAAEPARMEALAGPISITVTATEHVWVRITVDGQTAFEDMLRPGTGHVWRAELQVIVETGNAAALIVDDGAAAIALGGRGQIVARGWDHSGSEDVPLAASNTLSRTGLKISPTSLAGQP
jgi:cytoskeletal protein RodZ